MITQPLTARPAWRRFFRLRAVFGLLLICCAGASSAKDSALVATATNFALTAERLKDAFEQSQAADIALTHGSTGKLFAQIVAGAPYDLFLAADTERPERLENLQLIVPGTRHTYAFGTLVLWSADVGIAGNDASSVLRAEGYRRLAIANPQLAPYGAAAAQVLARLGLLERLRSVIVRGENVGQAYAMVASGNAEIGLLATSSLVASQSGRSWQVPAELYEPIRQDMVLLSRASANPAATAFYEFLRSDVAAAIIAADGYRLDAGR